MCNFKNGKVEITSGYFEEVAQPVFMFSKACIPPYCFGQRCLLRDSQRINEAARGIRTSLPMMPCGLLSNLDITILAERNKATYLVSSGRLTIKACKFPE